MKRINVFAKKNFGLEENKNKNKELYLYNS